MIGFGAHTRVYLMAGATDMRKQIDALAALVEDVLEQDPFSNALFAFCNQRRDKLKLLFWHRNGFWLWYRRLERQRFWWPEAEHGQAIEAHGNLHVTADRKRLLRLAGVEVHQLDDAQVIERADDGEEHRDQGQPHHVDVDDGLQHRQLGVEADGRRHPRH